MAANAANPSQPIAPSPSPPIVVRTVARPPRPAARDAGRAEPTTPSPGPVGTESEAAPEVDAGGRSGAEPGADDASDATGSGNDAVDARDEEAPESVPPTRASGTAPPVAARASASAVVAESATRSEAAPAAAERKSARRVTSATGGHRAAALPPTRKVEFPSAKRDEKRPDKTSREEQAAASAKPRGGAATGDQPMSLAKMLLVAGGAGVAAYLGVSLMFGKHQPATDAVPAAKPNVVASAAAPPASAGAPGPAQPGKAVDRQKLAAKADDLPLPPGFVLGPGKGLLEVDTGGNQSIYVDGTFVGHGPLRRIPLPPGRHTVETRQNGDQRQDEVDVSAGRRARLPLADAWK